MNLRDYFVAIAVFISFILVNIRFFQMRSIAKKQSKRMNENWDFHIVMSLFVFLYGALLVTLVKYFVDGEI